MKTKYISALALFIFSLSAIAFAEIEIKAEVNKAKITTDQTLTYKLIVNSSLKNIPQPKLPEFKGFEILSRVQSSSLSAKKGELKRALIFVLILYPTEAGLLKIGASTIKAKGKTYSTDAFEIEVSQGKKPIKPQKIPLEPGQVIL